MQEELLRKLRYKQGRALVLHPPEGYRLGIEEDGPGEVRTCDFVQLFVNNAAEVDERVEDAIALLKDDAVFWITYPKARPKFKPDINRDSLFALVHNKTSFRAVSNVAVDEQWSALRFRHQDKVNK